MASSINPNTINGLYPIAGQDNDSQGFRDNFTNIKNNFNFARSEINDLQNKVILKSPLTGSTLNNNMAGSLLSNVSLNSDTHKFQDHGTLGDPGSPTDVDLDFRVATVHFMTTNGTLFFNLVNMPTGEYATIRLFVNVTNSDHNIHFNDVGTVNGLDRVEGFIPTGTLITFADLGNFPATYAFEVSTTDGGATLNIVDLFRGRSFTDGDFTVNGDITVTGKLTVSDGLDIINSNFSEVTVVNDDIVTLDTGTHTWFLDTASSATIANAWIVLPSDVENGREIVISTLAPITSANITTDDLGLSTVKWANLNIFSAGNVSAKFLYSTDSSAWLKV